MKIAGIEWDNGNWPKCGQHGVSQDEIEHVLRHIEFRARDPFDGEERYRTALTPPDGRPVFVVYTHRQIKGETWLRPISARYMHEKEIRSYEHARQEALAKAREP